jgi:hypothetical protein
VHFLGSWIAKNNSETRDLYIALTSSLLICS